MRLDLIKEIDKLYDNNCKICPVKKARDGNKRKSGKPVRADKGRCEYCTTYKEMARLRKQLEG